MTHEFSRRSLLAQGGAALTMALGARRLDAQQQLPQSVAELTRVAEDVYMWRSIGHNSIFIVARDAVIVCDPIALGNPRSAQMFLSAIRSVTDAPVKYLVYSHEHADHATGGAIFADTLEAVISHRLAAPKIAARNNGLTPLPTFLVDNQASAAIGGVTIDLIYTGRNHSDNSLVLYYQARSLLFAVDFIPVLSLPFRTLDDSYLDEWLQSLRWIEDNLNFNILVPGHGPLGNKSSVTAMRVYFEDLMAAIRASRARNEADNSPAMVTSVRQALTAKYSTWSNFGPYLPENIQGVIRMWREQGGA